MRASVYLLYRRCQTEQVLERFNGVGEVVEDEIRLTGLELFAAVITSGNRHGDRSAGSGTGNVARRVADDDDRLGLDAEFAADALAADRHQAGTVAVVGAERAELEVDI